MKNKMMNAALGLSMIASIAGAEEAINLSELQAQLKMQQQEMTDLLAKMEQLEEKQSTTKEDVKAISWAKDIKLKADMRYRYEHSDIEDSRNKNRQRVRARIGLEGKANDEVTLGFRLSTGADANSGNQTLGDQWDDKEIYLDLAYINYAPVAVDGLDVTLGKFKYPWYVATDLLWDGDVNPEGIAATYETKVGETKLFGTTGYMLLTDQSTDSTDWDMAAFQIGAEQKLSENVKLTLASSVFAYQNSVEVAGTPEDYTVVQGTAALGVKKLLPVPVKFYIDAVTNTEADTDENGYYVGIKFGDAKKGKWEIKYDYRNMEENAAPTILVDSDFAGGGTGVKGSRFKAKYNLGKNFQLGSTYIIGQDMISDRDQNTFLFDLIAKF